MDLYGFALLSLSSLFAVIDPLGCIPFFSGQTAGLSRDRKRRILVKALVVSLLVLLLFTYAGSAVLHTFGITVDAFRIAGGVIFFGVGLDMLQSRPRRWHTGLDQAAAGPDHVAPPDPDHDPSVTPLAIPMIAGPASITTVMVLRAETPGATGALIVAAAAALILLLTGVILLTADTVLRRLGPTGMRIVEKLMGLLVTVIAVQLVMNGAAPFLRDLVAAAGN